MARPTHFVRKILASGEVQRIAFDRTQYAAVGVPYSPLAGVPELEAYQLVNKWNIQQADQRFVYGLE